MIKFNPQPKQKAIRIKNTEKYQAFQTEVLERDNYTCRISGVGLSREVPPPPHHLLPRGRGGSDVLENAISVSLKIHEDIEHGRIKVYGPASKLQWTRKAI